MSHQPDLNRLSALVDGRLTPVERESLLTHVAECRECRDVLSLLASQHAAAPARASWWQRPAVWLPVAAMLAVASVSVLLVTSPGRAPASAPSQPQTTPSEVPRPAIPPTGSGGKPTPEAPEPTTPTPAPANASDDLLRTRSGSRRIGDKTFQLVAGEWIDGAYDPGALLPVREITSEAGRRDLLSRTPALQPYAALGNRMTVVHEGTVYRFGVP